MVYAGRTHRDKDIGFFLESRSRSPQHHARQNALRWLDSIKGLHPEQRICFIVVQYTGGLEQIRVIFRITSGKADSGRITSGPATHLVGGLVALTAAQWKT